LVVANRSNTQLSDCTGNTYQSREHCNQFDSRTDIRTHKRVAVAGAGIGLLAERWSAFPVYGLRRLPLKLQIHLDVLSALGGDAITLRELKAALRHYVGNPSYLKACGEGANRIDLARNAVVGKVTVAEAEHARQRLERYQAKRRQRMLASIVADSTQLIADSGWRRRGHLSGLYEIAWVVTELARKRYGERIKHH
jgi:RNA chaperone ProQ/FINO-like protein